MKKSKVLMQVDGRQDLEDGKEIDSDISHTVPKSLATPVPLPKYPPFLHLDGLEH